MGCSSPDQHVRLPATLATDVGIAESRLVVSMLLPFLNASTNRDPRFSPSAAKKRVPRLRTSGLRGVGGLGPIVMCF